jgi:hypothetical protein
MKWWEDLELMRRLYRYDAKGDYHISFERVTGS